MLLQVVWLLFAEPEDGENLLLAFPDEQIAHVLDRTQRGMLLAVLVATVLVIAVRWWRASAPRRRALLPSVAGALTLTLFTALLLNDLVSGARSEPLLWATACSLVTVPLAFLYGQLRSRLARGALANLFSSIGGSRPGELQPALARALGDPDLRVGYWRPETGTYADADGAPVSANGNGERVIAHVERDGRPLAALVYDASLDDDPELVDAVTAAAGIAIDNTRLLEERELQLAEIKASRERIVAAGDAERRRLERNLHDGAQQRLVGIALQLRLLQNRVQDDPSSAQLVAGASDELGPARSAELRELARGIHPAVLEHGLGAALDSLATRALVPTHVDCELPRERLPEQVELAAYFVVCEALANVAKYARARHASDPRPLRGRRPARRGRRRRRRRRRRDARQRPARARRPRRGARRAPVRDQPDRRRDDRARGAAVRVVIADDNLLVRRGIVALLEEAGLEVTAQAGEVEGLLAAVEADTPDIAIVDIRMPPTHTDEGLRAAQAIRERHPGIGIVVLSQHLETGVAARVLAEHPAGLGYLLKDRVTDVAEFVSTLRTVAAGGTALDPQVISRLLASDRGHGPLRDLTAREREVLQLLAEGHSNPAIAARLDITRRSTEKYVSSIFTKLGLPDTGNENRRVLAVLTALRS